MAFNWVRFIRIVAGIRECPVTYDMAREWAALCRGLTRSKSLDILEDKFSEVIDGA